MRSFSRIAILALPLLGTVFAEISPSPTEPSFADLKQDFQDLLNALPEESLQAALHGHLPHFRNGVFESGRHGLDAVHDQDPHLASKLIVAAIQNLTKRQTSNDNSTVTNNTPDTSQTPTPPPSSGGGSSASPPPSNTPSTPSESDTVRPPSSSARNSNTPTATRSSPSPPATPAPTPSTTIVVSVTKTNSEGSTFTTKETSPAIILTTTNSAGKTLTTASPIKITPTPKEVTTTNAKGSTFVTTVTPGGGKVSSVVLVTEKGPDGEQVTRTSYVVVDPAEATGEPAEGGSQTSERPGLQTGGAVMGAGLGNTGLWAAGAGIVAMLI